MIVFNKLHLLLVLCHNTAKTALTVLGTRLDVTTLGSRLAVCDWRTSLKVVSVENENGSVFVFTRLNIVDQYLQGSSVLTYCLTYSLTRDLWTYSVSASKGTEMCALLSKQVLLILLSFASYWSKSSVYHWSSNCTGKWEFKSMHSVKATWFLRIYYPHLLL